MFRTYQSKLETRHLHGSVIKSDCSWSSGSGSPRRGGPRCRDLLEHLLLVHLMVRIVRRGGHNLTMK